MAADFDRYNKPIKLWDPAFYEHLTYLQKYLKENDSAKQEVIKYLEELVVDNPDIWVMLDAVNWPKQASSVSLTFDMNLQSIWPVERASIIDILQNHPDINFFHALYGPANTQDPFLQFAEGEGLARDISLINIWLSFSEKYDFKHYQNRLSADFYEKCIEMLERLQKNKKLTATQTFSLTSSFSDAGIQFMPNLLIPRMLKFILNDYAHRPAHQSYSSHAKTNLEKLLVQNIQDSDSEFSIKDLRSPETVMLAYHAFVNEGYIRGGNRSYAFWASADRREYLDELKKQVYQLAIDSGDPAKFFTQHKSTIDPLMRKHHNEGIHLFHPWSVRLMAKVQRQPDVARQIELLATEIGAKETKIQKHRPGPKS